MLPTKAVTQLDDSSDALLRLKRLILFFDSVDYFVPASVVLKPEVSPYAHPGMGKTSQIVVDFLRDTYRGLRLVLGQQTPELGDALQLLQEHQLVADVTGKDEADQFKRLRDALLIADIHDDRFNSLAGCTRREYEGNARVTGVRIALAGGEEKVLHVVDVPQAVDDSYELTTILYHARAANAFPVFAEPRHRNELLYKYEQFRTGAVNLPGNLTEMLEIDRRARFGEITFTLVSSVVTSEALVNRSVEDILRYRNELRYARERFMSETMGELAANIADNPWSVKLRDDVNRFIEQKLRADLARYDIEATKTWEKMFGSLAIHVARAAPTATAGGAAGGVVADLLPHISPWSAVLIGVAAAVARQVPEMVQDLVDYALAERDRRRSGIAYLANLIDRK